MNAFESHDETARASLPADAISQVPALNEPALSRRYAIATSVVLVAGWYLVPILGWVAGLIMIGAGDRWPSSVRRRSILASVGVIAISTIGLVVFRGSELWLVGLIIFGAGPLVGNIFVADYLRRRWAPSVR